MLFFILHIGLFYSIKKYESMRWSNGGGRGRGRGNVTNDKIKVNSDNNYGTDNKNDDSELASNFDDFLKDIGLSSEGEKDNEMVDNNNNKSKTTDDNKRKFSTDGSEKYSSWLDETHGSISRGSKKRQ